MAAARALGYQRAEVWLPGDDAGAEELVWITSEAVMLLAQLAAHNWEINVRMLEILSSGYSN